MSTASQSDDPRLPIYPMEVFRVKAGMRLFVRCLSVRYSGLFTHWFRGRSHYCDPDGCNTVLHKLDRVWKGYLAAEAWIADQDHWLGIVLELTEHSELDIRSTYARGRVYELARGVGGLKKQLPCVARPGELLDPKNLPSAFDIMPALQRTYHCPHLQLSAANPMPARPTRPVSTGLPPAGLERQREAEAASPADIARLKSSIGDFLRSKKPGSEI